MPDTTTVLAAVQQRLQAHTARGLATAVSRLIRDDVLAPGDLLPPIRAVASEVGLSPTTVSAAWELLTRSGMIRTDGRRGTAVAEPMRAGSLRYDRTSDRRTAFELDLSTGVPDPALLPDLSRAVVALTESAATPSSYLDPPVLPGLVEVLRADWPYPAEALTVVDGAMDGIELATRLLVRFGDRVVVEHPAFPPLLDLLEARGVEVIGVPVDAEGLSVDGLRAALAEGAVAAVYLQPRAQNPTGASLTPRRGHALAAALRHTDTVVVEDDSAGAVAASRPVSLGTWRPEGTVHIRSFAKSHGPDLRLAALSGPAELVGGITRLRRLGQGWSSRLLQRLLLSLLSDPVSIRAVDSARRQYARRRRLLARALGELGVAIGDGDGLNIWLPVLDETAAVAHLAGQGIGVAPGSPFEVLPDRPHIRVTAGSLARDHKHVARMLAEAASGTVRIGV